MLVLGTTLYILATYTHGVLGWGALGHQTVGYFLAPNARAFVQSSLGSTYNQSLGPAATWADNVRYTSGYTWSAPFHYVDAEDSPLAGSCSVQETRDCGRGNCILTAIANYTTRVAQTSLSAAQRQEALMFLASCHLYDAQFLGDIGQPLHVEAYEVGGNDISARCSGSSTNLHSAWDTGMVTKNINDNHGRSAVTYAADLVARIRTGSYSNLTSDWLSCTSITQPVSRRFAPNLNVSHTIEDDVNRLLVRSPAIGPQPAATPITPLQCPLVWARESNAFCCSVVFAYSSGQDLCTSSYFAQAVPVIDLQLAKQGYRLAAWLNVIFDGAPNLP
ncbi:nuclease Le1 [Earliella scabrosa]|nr:nuclease Le1 [Earliella scabrosa]